MNIFRIIGFIALICILSILQTNGHRITERDASQNNPIVNALIDAIGSLPFSQQLLRMTGKSVRDILNGINGAIGRFLGGALPCVVSIQTGLWCSGVAKSGGASKLLEKSIDSIPPMVIPEPVKAIIKTFLRPLINPIADVIFGGNRIQQDVFK